MTDELVYTYWSADTSPLTDRATCALRAVQKAFPETRYWNAGPQKLLGPENTHQANLDECAPGLVALWKEAIKIFDARDLSSDELVVEGSVHSNRLESGVRVFFNDALCTVTSESAVERRLLNRHEDVLIDIVRNIGKCKSIGGCWLRRHSAFAGRPEFIYEPPTPFAKLYHALKFEQVIEQVRQTREAVRSALGVNDLIEILADLDVPAEKLGRDRVFARLGSPTGKGGAAVLKQVRERIKPLLKQGESVAPDDGN